MSASTSPSTATVAAVKAEWKKAKAAKTPVAEAAPAVAQTPVAEATAQVVAGADAVEHTTKSWKDAATAQFGDVTEQLHAWRQTLADAFAASFEPEASFTRKACAYVVSLCASFGTGYLVGLAMNAVLVTAAVSTSLFLTILVWVLGLLIALYLGSKVGEAVYNGIVHSVIEDTVAGAWHSVTGWFTTEKVAA